MCISTEINLKETFTTNLLDWHRTTNKRTMPWKGEKDAYKIWISEIILQQTRVEQGLRYYSNFISRFPDVTSLASAKDEDVYKAWEGLGYYSRCRNLLHSARKLVQDTNGKLPTAYKDILALKGIGAYTAAAISSFAYDLPHAVVDGNVLRVLSRYFGKATPIDSTEGKAEYTHLADELLHKGDSAAYNQAIMDFGATVCTPKQPLCHDCPLQQNCAAYAKGIVNKLPVKEKQLIKKKRWFTYFIFMLDNKVLVKKRTAKDIWQNLFEFYLHETDKEKKWSSDVLTKWLEQNLSITDCTINSISKAYQQQLTHQTLQGRFVTVSLSHYPLSLQEFTVTNISDVSKLPFPKFINQFLKEGFAKNIGRER